MTVDIGTQRVVSDMSPAEAAFVDGVCVLSRVDGLLLPAEAAQRIVRWVRCAGRRDDVGETVPVGAGTVMLRGIDGVTVDRDTAVGVLRITEQAAAATRCRLTVAFAGHDPLPYSASLAAARAFAERIAGHADVRIEGPALDTDPRLPCERLWAP